MQQFVPPLTGVTRQSPGLECFLPRGTPQRPPLPQRVIESDRLQRVLHSRSHLHPLMSVTTATFVGPAARWRASRWSGTDPLSAVLAPAAHPADRASASA